MFWQMLGRANAPEGHFAISCAENMTFFKQTSKKDFIMPLKSNRKVAFAPQPKKKGNWHALDSLDFDTDPLLTLYLDGVPFPVRVIRQVFTNEDDSRGILYLCTSDLSLSKDDLVTIYQKRWKCESCQRQLCAGRGVS